MMIVRLGLTALIVSSLACCDGGGEGGDGDTTTTDGTDTTDTADITEDGQEAEEPSDTPVEDAPVPCAGTDTLRLELVDSDGAPVEGVPVALRCADEIEESSSGADGLVVFENLDLENWPVDFTFVYEGRASTMIGVGGPAAVPDPFRIHVAPSASPETVTMEGDVVHTVDGTTMALIGPTTPMGIATGDVDRYSVATFPGETGLHLYVFEWMPAPGEATPVSNAMIAYDSPESGVDGPVAEGTSTIFGTAALQLDFDLRADSPLREAVVPTDGGRMGTTRVYSGARLTGYDENGRFMLFGYTMNWTGDWTSARAEVAWIPDAYDAAARIIPDLWLNDDHYFNFYAFLRLPPDPTAWDTYTVHDIPEIPGASMDGPVTFDREITVSRPEWTPAVTAYHVRLQTGYGALFEDGFLWRVMAGPEATSFSFDGLPWPSSVSLDSVLPHGITLLFGSTTRIFDEDPFADYVFFRDEVWAENHFLGIYCDSRYFFDLP